MFFHELKIFACCFDRVTVHMFKLVNPGFFVALVIFDHVEHGSLLFCPKPAIKYEFTPFKTPKQIVDRLVVKA